jgi:hypothetical protein
MAEAGNTNWRPTKPMQTGMGGQSTYRLVIREYIKSFCKKHVKK